MFSDSINAAIHLLPVNIFSLLFATVVTSLLLFAIYRRRRSSASDTEAATAEKLRFPPCLPSLPIVGSIPFLPEFEKLHQFFLEKTGTYGNVFAFYLVDKYVVVLNGRDTIRDALVKNSTSFADRPPFYTDQLLFNTKRNGIMCHAYDDDFKKFHKTTLSILRQFGFGKRIMEDRIQREVEELIVICQQFGGGEFDPADLVSSSVFNVIASILFGQRFQHYDPKLNQMLDIVRKIARDFAHRLMALNFFPALRFLPRYRRAIQDSRETMATTFDLLDEKIKQSLSGKTGESFIRCYVEEEGSGYDHKQLVVGLRDLFLGGTDTTATSIQWLIVLLANHPRIQERLHREIDSVVPITRFPSLDDKPQLPYATATVLELMRRTTLGPLGLPHMTLTDTQVCGFSVPAKSMVLVNLYSAHMDPKVWRNPEEFNPDRFIHPTDGSVIGKDLVIPFSLGKRSCIGEMLARQELFLFMTGLLQQFDILPPEGHEQIDCHEIMGVTSTPSPYKARFVARIKKQSPQ